MQFFTNFKDIVNHKEVTRRQDDEKRIVVSKISVFVTKLSIKNDMRHLNFINLFFCTQHRSHISYNNAIIIIKHKYLKLVSI